MNIFVYQESNMNTIKNEPGRHSQAKQDLKGLEMLSGVAYLCPEVY